MIGVMNIGALRLCKQYFSILDMTETEIYPNKTCEIRNVIIQSTVLVNSAFACIYYTDGTATQKCKPSLLSRARVAQ